MTARDLQILLNKFSKQYRLGFTPLQVDGKMGPSTKARVRHVKYLLGYPREFVDSEVDKKFVWRLRNPKKSGEYDTTWRTLKRGKERRILRRKDVRRNHAKASIKPGVAYYDGKPVARPFIPYLKWARANGWKGQLVSGWRDPAYSEQLCYNMCGRPSCPGRCAGRASRHSQVTLEGGAMDVSDYYTFGRLMARAPFATKLRNTLGAQDPVHFSKAGN